MSTPVPDAAKPLHIATPLLESGAFSPRPGQSVWLKMEALQPTGSFKLRGIGHACAEYQRRGAKRFISSSGGNAGIAAAYSGRKLGVPVLVVVPESSSARARALIAREGAEILVHGATFHDCPCARLVAGGGWRCVHPPVRRPASVGRARDHYRRDRGGRRETGCGGAVGGRGRAAVRRHCRPAPPGLGRGARHRRRDGRRRRVRAIGAGRAPGRAARHHQHRHVASVPAA